MAMGTVGMKGMLAALAKRGEWGKRLRAVGAFAAEGVGVVVEVEATEELRLVLVQLCGAELVDVGAVGVRPGDDE